ncbi:unnamed protein product [Microthlaspi erraticum]|uniref:Aminotransferase-like plant mobile domain-containing protein n=1 Tax=Microthlaspi erraticum TaxID=1685480 RepID=A0A6D2IGI8_9BRAS|nr:unnamed protein product [Microthlaspi erraticum]
MESRGSSDQEDEHIVQVREALMCPDGEKFEGLRTARFLNYTTASIDDQVFDLPLDAFSYRPQTVNPVKWTAKISFPGWGSPSLNWIEWVNAMAESHATVWRKSGVHDAILASRYQIKKRDDLIMALIEKWCIETNTFVFNWGEATVTLEDMIVLGGFSVIGNNALAPIKKGDMKEVEEKMKTAKRGIEADSGKKCSVSSWMKTMMSSGNEIEHEAFMVSWLSRFVFPNSADLLRDLLFPAAIQLAKGVRLALAPAVLAGVYRDLGVLKEHIAGYSERESVVVKSPFQFVQVWAFERIMELQPPGGPSQLKPGEPRMARWHQYGGGGQDAYGYTENVRAVLDSAKESFDYRPYTKPLSNFTFPRFYLEDDCWVRVDSGDKNIVSFGRCLRFSKLVGLDCIEPYYPHRVALQFGYDQDVPGVVPARIESPELAWKDYIRPVSDDMLYIPARLHEGDVTVGYIRWWRLSVAILQSEAKKIADKLLASPPRQKPVTPTAAATTPTKTTSYSPGKWKTSGAKADRKDQELVKKRETETKRGTSSVTGSRMEVDRAEGRSHSSSSYGGSKMGSEEATKRSLKKPEWVQRPSPSFGRAAVDVKDLRGALKGSGGTKGQGHVTFQLPDSPPERSPPPKSPTLFPKQSDSSVQKSRMLPRVVGNAKQSRCSPQVPSRHASSVSLPPNHIKNNNSPSQRVSKPSSVSGSSSSTRKLPRSPEAVNLRGQKNSPSPRGSKDRYKSPSVSGSSSLTRKKSSLRSPEAVNSRGTNSSQSPRVSKDLNKSSFSSLTRKKSPSPRSSEAVNSHGDSSPRGDSAVKRNNTDVSTTASKQESPRKTQQLEIGKATTTTTNVKSLEEIVTLREHVDEGGEVTYHIPKQQFEDLTQGVQDVLQDLQSIKSALNIQDHDE